MFTTLSFMRFFHKPEIKNILSFSLLKSHNHKQSITCLICPLQFFLIPHKRCIFNKKFKLHFSQSPIWIAEKKKKKNLPLFQILSFHFFPSNSALKVISMKIMSFYSLPSQALLLFLPPPKLFLSWRGKSCGQQAVLCLGPSSHSLTLSSPVSRFKVMTQFAVHWRQRNDACRVKKKTSQTGSNSMSRNIA